MTQGGARARSGPLPDPNAIRTGATWTNLPARRDGPVPAWPVYAVSPPPDDAELAKWAQMWTLPQAVMWEASQRHDEVALHVRSYLRAMAMGRELGEVRQQLAALALTDDSLARHRWRITADEPAAPEARRPNGSRSTAARSRFKTIPGGAA